MKKQADYIKRIEIKGLWGRKNIAWELQPDVNILSGVNGGGKSTILNIRSSNQEGFLSEYLGYVVKLSCRIGATTAKLSKMTQDANVCTVTDCYGGQCNPLLCHVLCQHVIACISGFTIRQKYDVLMLCSYLRHSIICHGERSIECCTTTGTDRADLLLYGSNIRDV